jgi:uncharacterized protein YjbI with pentapeptide repeats
MTTAGRKRAMADPNHIEIFEEGVAVWNAWRKVNPDVRPDLSGSNIRIRDLSSVNLSRADLKGIRLAGSDLSGADLAGADLSRADLMESNLSGADLRDAVLKGANLMGADLSSADLSGANLEDAILYRADLEGSGCAFNHVWLGMLMDFADGLKCAAGEEEGFAFEDTEDSCIESSFMSTEMSRLDIELSDPVSAKAIYEILGALNRIYSVVADSDLPGPIIRIGPSQEVPGE